MHVAGQLVDIPPIECGTTGRTMARPLLYEAGMRTTAFALVASLALTPGCLQLAAPPVLGGAAGAGIGAAISDSEHRAGATVIGGVLGVLVGLVADVVLVGYFIESLVNQDESGVRR
jgi:hypothetical protein